nr:ABC transporter ATP-binding protein [Paenibacillus sp. MMS18-CY102]
MYAYRWLLQNVNVYTTMPVYVALSATQAASNKDSLDMDGFAERRCLLHGLDLAIRPGDWVNLVGANGSGKSTLAKVLAGFGQHEATGSIETYALSWFADERSNEVLEQSNRGRNMGFAPLVTQNPELAIVGMTAAEDAMLLLEQLAIPDAEIPSRVADALQRTGLGSLANKPIGQLSGGQKQLAAIAGCIASGADALILDEPTSMLDPEASAAVLQAVRELNRSGTTVVWITQQLEELREGDRVVALANGYKVFDGAAPLFFGRFEGEASSPCERAGLIAPYVVQTVWGLQQEGIELIPAMPLSMDAFVKAVASYGS